MKNKKIDVRSALSLIFVLIALASVIYFICGPMEGYIHSDFTDTIYWANASVESGEVFDPDFRYAALLPFSANLWFVPLVAVFGVSMTAQVIGMVIFALVFAASLWFMCRSFKWSIPATSATVASVMLLLSLSEKLREIMWGHVIYYSLILTLVFVGLGLAARLLRAKPEKEPKYIALCAATALWFILSATNGVQIVAMVVLPVAGAILAEIFFDGNRSLTDKRNFYPICVSAGIIFAGAAGLLLLTVLKGDISADYADGHMSLSSVRYWVNNILALPEAWFGLLGFDELKDDMGMLPALVSALAGVILSAMPLALLFNYKKIDSPETKLLLWAHIAVSAVTLAGWICGVLAGAEWRLTSMLGTSAVTTAAAVKHFLGSKEKSEQSTVLKRVSAVTAACIAAVAILGAAVMIKMPADYGRDGINHRLTEKLKSEGLEYGYATFWRSQAITLISDSEVKVREILADEFDGVYTDYYQSSRLWYEDMEGVDRYFVLLEEYEAGDASRNPGWETYVEEKASEIVEFENFVIYVFEENIDFEALAEMQSEE